MANKKHLEILNQGVCAWNEWRQKSPEIEPDLGYANLVGQDLSGADFRGADLTDSNLALASLNEAILIGANLSDSHLLYTKLNKADLRNANLANVNLHYASLVSANLGGALLFGTILSYADVSGANLSHATMGSTTLAHNDLSTVIGLNSVIHIGSSSVGVDTLYMSEGKIPKSFLLGAGLPENFIKNLEPLERNARHHNSCFISYSSNDYLFAKRLYKDLQKSGIHCWFAPKTSRIGERIRTTIEESIQKYDKLLLILSKDSIASHWVESEVEAAIEREHVQKRAIILPIRLDDTVMNTRTGWSEYIRRTRYIGDFRNSNTSRSYKKGFKRLLHDLQAG